VINQQVPIYPYYGYTYSQVIYLASEIGSVSSGQITGVRYFQQGGLSSSDNWTVYIGSTVKSSFASTTDWEPVANLTQVFSGTAVSTGGVVEITFSSPFAYSGGNLILAVDENQPGYGSSADDFFCTNAGANRCLFYYSDGTNPNPASPPSGTREPYIANVELLGTDLCNQISALSISNVAAYTTDMSWAPAAGATDYNVEWGTSGYAPGIGLSAGSITVANPLVTIGALTPLTPEVCYDVYVQTNCAAGSGSWVGPISFCALPLCPEPSSVSATAGALDAQITWTAGGIETDWNVEYGPVGFPLGSGTTDATTATVDGILGLNQLTCYNYYVQANCVSVNATSLWVGPLDFCTVATCPEPSGLSSSVVSPDSVEIFWTAGGVETEWTISYGAPGFVAGSGLSLVTTTNPDFLTGLMSDTDYEYYIQANCGTNDASVWVGPMTFTTAISCAEVTGITMTAVTIDSAYIMWTAGGTETSWNVEFGMDGFTPGSGTISVESTTDVALGNLTAGTDYDFYVQAICGAGDSAQWVGPFNFMTVISCAQPTNLDAINISNSSANLIFQAGGSETEWSIEWGVPGFVVGNGEETGMVANTTNNPYYATGLNPSSTYEYYVQASCGAGDLSTWAGPFTFNTLLANDLVCNAIDLPTDASIGTYNNIGASLNGDDVLTPTAGWSGSAVVNAPVWFSFVGPASGNVTVSTENDVTISNNSRTEIAIYSANDCGNFGTYALLGANGDGPAPGVGSIVSACGLTAGDTYYVMVDGYSSVGTFSSVAAFQGAFGISVEAVDLVEAGNAVAGNICTNDATDIFDAIEGYSNGNGTWYYPNATAAGAQAFASNGGSLVLSGLDAGVAYTFDYVVSIGCASDTVSTSYMWSPQPNAGDDGAVTSCVNSEVLLIQELTGSVAFGGTWSDDDNVGGLVNGVVYPYAIAAGTYNFSYVIVEGACSDTAVVAVTIDACLGVDANEVSALEVYPNPVADVLTIANLTIDGNATIALLDLQGKVVYSTTVSNVNGNYELDLSKFENGIYVVAVTSELNTQKVRVVKH